MFEKSCAALLRSGSAAGAVTRPAHNNTGPAAALASRPRLNRRSWAAGLMCLLGAVWMVPVVCAGTTYYASTTGSSGNNGLSASSPWTLDYALSHCGTSNTVIVLPGTYTGGAYSPSFNYVTVRSSVKWGARIVNSGTSGLASYPAGVGLGTIFDGFEVTGQSYNNVYLVNPNCTIRNCWLHQAGASAIEAHPQNGTVVEDCLIEHSGSLPTQHHGIYISGDNVVVRGNVCRYNAASGIALGDNAVLPRNMRVYNNLCYGNGTWGLVAGGVLSGATMYVYDNTLVGGPYGIGAGGSVNSLFCTNNIIIGTSSAVNVWSGGFIQGNYNLMSSADFSQSHGLITSQPGFVNTSRGLFWLSTSSVAIGGGLGSVCGPIDFFGNPQSSIGDLGAFQYNSVYAADTRVLDPSPAGGADYWQFLGGTNGSGGGGSPGGGSTTNAFSFQASAGILTAPFIVTNGYVCQLVDTVAPDGGRAVYNFTTTTAGVYVVTAVVNAPDGSHNSFYVTIDGAAPNEPYNLWDIPYTSGFQSETVAWRANGTWDADEFAPKAFTLAAGAHSLLIVGRESNTQLQSIQIQLTNRKPPAAPSSLTWLVGP